MKQKLKEIDDSLTDISAQIEKAYNGGVVDGFSDELGTYCLTLST